MPELSSIAREPDVVDGAVEEQEIRVKATRHDEAEYYQRSLDNPDIFSILALTTQFDIPSCDLPALQGVAYDDDDASNRRRTVYGLGAGVSCSVIQHQTDAVVSNICPPGTLVALKKYNEVSSELVGERSANKKLHQLLWQELKVFCHPYLKDHENICRLIFIGWEDTSIIPTLGLELAAYGTLEDCLQLLRSYGSEVRKTHLSLDIALGINAIHACGLVHGDIKPSNIIIQEHPTRTVIAKISDFNGVGLASSYGSSRFSFGTPSWQAPEVLLREHTIDWQLADVYSYGMVLATIWCANGFIPVGGSFLDTVLPYKMDIDAKRDLLEFYKISPDHLESSIMAIALRSTKKETEPPLVLAKIITDTLSTLSGHRKSLTLVVSECFRKFAAGNARDLSSLSQQEDNAVIEDYYKQSYIDNVWVLHPSYLQRRRPFKENILRALLAASKKLKDSIQLPQILDLKPGVNLTDEQLLDFLRIQDRKIKTALWEDEKLHQFSGLALEIALSFFLGHGTSINEEAGIAWLNLAAGAGEGLSIYLFGPLEQSIANAAPHIALPRRLWCCHATLAGYMHSTACLKDLDPQLHDIAIKMHRRRYWGRDQPQIVRIEPYLPNFVQLIKDNLSLVDSEAPSRRGYTSIKETALHLCAATGNMESTRYLILEAKANIDTTNERNETPIFYATQAGQFEIAKFLLEQGANVSHVSTEGIAIAHCLVMMDDHHAAELAPLYVNRGASLNVIAKEKPGVRKDNFTLGVGIPLFWAALKCQPLLFAALLQLHSRPGSKVSMPDFYQLVSELAALNMHGMLKLALDSEISIVDAKLKASVPRGGEIEELLSKMELESRKTDPNQHGSGYLSKVHYSALLYTAMDSWSPQLLKRRYIHRTGFRTAKRETIALLLELGADPVFTHVSNEPDANPEHDIPLTLSVYTGDSIAFSLFIDWMRSQQIEILPLLEDSQRYSGYNALQRSIYTDSKEIFLLLLDLYPSLLNGVGMHGRRPLHSAAVMEWPGYVKELLRRGAGRHDRANDGSTPFAWALMRNQNIEIADILAEGADMESILGPDPKSGFTAFGKLLSGLTAYKIDFGLDRLRYLVRKFGKPSLFANNNSPDRTTVFRSLLALRPLPMDNAQISLQSAILKFLLEVFPAEINYRDDTGRAALHYAVMFGNLAAVEILLEARADVSLEIGPMNEDHPLYIAKTPIQGYTSLAMAVATKERGPKDEVLRGGQREIEAWERNMQQIIDTLIRHGAGEPGSGVNLFDSVSTGIATGTMSGVYVGSNTVRRSDRSWEGAWPKRLPWEEEPPEFNVAGCSVRHNAAVEIIDVTGLTVRMPHGSLRIMQDLVGAIDPSVLTGSLVEELPPQPEGFLEQIQSQVAEMKISHELFKLQDSLPDGWEVRRQKEGRVYFVDHNTKTTSWTPPQG